jgi:hypothetical protein
MAFMRFYCYFKNYYILNFNIFIFKNKADPALLNGSYSYNLQQRLFSGYDCWVRPVLLPNTKTNITLDFTLLQLVSMV